MGDFTDGWPLVTEPSRGAARLANTHSPEMLAAALAEHAKVRLVPAGPNAWGYAFKDPLVAVPATVLFALIRAAGDVSDDYDAPASRAHRLLDERAPGWLDAAAAVECEEDRQAAEVLGDQAWDVAHEMAPYTKQSGCS